MTYDAIFLSPHLDDAVLSCGNLITKMTTQNQKVCIVTFFTRGDVTPHADADDFVTKSGFTDYELLFNSRRAEDKKATYLVGADTLHLAYVDALFRSVKISHQKQFLYPSYQDVFSGQLSSLDDKLILQIENELKNILRKKMTKKTVVYAPLAIGGHVDHVLIYTLAYSHVPHQVYYWEDVPYRNEYLKVVARERLLQDQLIHLTKETHLNPELRKRKEKAVRLYSSQFSGLLAAGLSDADYFTERLYTPHS